MGPALEFVGFLFRASAVLALFVAFVLFTRRTNREADRTGGMLLLVLGLPPLLPSLLRPAGIWLPLESLAFLYGPLFYFYTMALSGRELPGPSRRLLHALPFALVVLVQLLAPQFFRPPGGWLHKITIYMILLSLVVYGGFAARILLAHRRGIPDQFAERTTWVTLGWLWWLLGAFFVALAILTLGNFILSSLAPPPAVRPDPPTGPPLPHSIAYTLFLLFVSYFVLRQPPLFPGSPVGPQQPDSEAVGKYVRSGLSEVEARSLVDRLFSCMQERQPFLNGDLTVRDLAAELQVSRHHLTQVLNETIGKNFFTFINEYRVTEARRLLETTDLPVMAVGYRSGFNTRSAFNDVFRRAVGSSPGAYRKGVRAEAAAQQEKGSRTG
ncbi:MAG: helix-turn-helix transcriptional regulator [Spirochaetales bacterium]|nr:helix-turn-helix transcriptional regulator [Leptospiraceae bacterium]MCP5480895.1 helix-turn-helix transcriptional regulator [Spirochaetales bacterium]MCP5485275.1 helix-turn-helix transcriptional regulator [Spirochaetales bacterium]